MYVPYDNKSLIPLKSGSSVSIVKLAKENVEEIIKIAAGIGPNYYNAYADFVAEMKANEFNVTEYNYDAVIPDESIIICVSENYPLPGKSLDIKEQQKRLAITQKRNQNSIINVALKDPYDVNVVSPDAYVSTMGSNISNIKAAVRLLSGKVEAKGSLPVSPIRKEHNKK